MKTLTLIRFSFAIGTAMCAFLLLTHCVPVYAGGTEGLQDSLNASRSRINKTAMFTLGAWALGNMAVNGTLLVSQSNRTPAERSSAYYFQQMNVLWNMVNLGLAAGGLYSSLTETSDGISLFETIEQQASIERILLLNAGLDAAYIATGAWMLERSKTKPDQAALWQGYGQSLILQGAFLLLFDVTVYSIHHTASEPIVRELLSSLRLVILPTSGLHIGLSLKW